VFPGLVFLTGVHPIPISKNPFINQNKATLVRQATVFIQVMLVNVKHKSRARKISIPLACQLIFLL